MAQEPTGHEKVRFRREEITPLEGFPSACPPLPVLCTARRSWIRRRIIWPATTLVALFLLLVAMVYGIGVSSIGNEQLRLQAERSIERLAGVDVDVSLGRLHLGFGRSSLFALEVHDTRIVRASDQEPIATAGKLRFGLRALPLLLGRIELARVAMAEAAFSPSGMPVAGGSSALLDENGLVRPDRLREVIFGAVHHAFATTRSSSVRRVSLTDIRLLAADADAPSLVVEELELRRAGTEEINFEGAAQFRGRHITFEGRAEQDSATGAVTALSFDLAAPEDENGPEASSGLVRALGAFSLSLTGRETDDTRQGILDLDMQLRDALIGFDQDEILVDSARARIAIAEGGDAFSIPGAQLAIGRTRINLRGTVSPSSSASSYEVELLSQNSVVAPADSPEPALPFAMRLTGGFDPAASKLTAERIEIRTAEGNLSASASLTVPPGMSPGVSLALHVADLPTAHVKQFWPWFAAPGARSWTLKNVFGGRVRDSELHLDVPPGRLGNGIPLAGDEVFGRFILSDTRFDIAGQIPPVRDGEGWVDFRGTDVNVGLTSGAIYMPSGRMVDASDGTFTINAHLTPRIGKLEIDVAGEAPAIVELASYEPIDASRFHDLTPEDLTGNMAGHISADIPLQAGIPADSLSWRVTFDYDSLSIAKQFEGQEVTQAKGKLLIQPDRAEIEAEAELNAIPASLRLVEPVGGAQVERVRHIELKLDDSSRDKLFPGLGLFVSGPFTVIYDERPGDQRQKIEISLDRARLEVPWIGWRKGSGIPATASFLMERDGDTVELSDFTLRGQSFALDGHLRIERGELREARFHRVRFNRNDDYAANIRRTARGGYAVTVDGASIDARGVIRQALGEATPAPGSGDGAASAVTVDASLDRAEGFNGEVLSQVELTYATDGSGPDQLSVTAAAAGFGAVKLTKGAAQGLHNVRATSSNAGAVLRFLDIYRHVESGQLSLALDGQVNSGTLSGRLDIRDFWVVNEPQMRSLVAATQQGKNGEVDVTRVHFEHGAAILTKGKHQLSIGNGVLRGPVIGSTFQGTLYDPNDNMDITGTFMPLYGFNRIFGELPLIGQILGNGRDRGLIGITYRLSGKFGDPTLQINPISAIAPGFLRQLFEFR